VKTITLHCPGFALTQLASSLELYANAAYPPGASECSQASRAALLDTVASINLQVATKTDEVTVSRRLRSNILAALRYAAENESNNPVYGLLIKAVSGEVVAGDEWQN
jgi:hypothetical protein